MSTSNFRISSLGLKLAVLAALLVGSIIPEYYVESIIQERQSYQQQAIQSVVSGWAARHQFGMVNLYVPVHHFETVAKKSKRVDDHSLNLDPTAVKIDLKDTVETRHRGIYDIPIYKADLLMQGEFLIPLTLDPQQIVSPGEQVLTFETKQGSAISEYTFSVNGVAYPLKRVAGGLTLEFKNKTFQPGEKLAFELKAKLNGYDGLDIATKADELDVRIASAWPHPSFKGQLPMDQNVSKDGFQAHWKVVQPGIEQVITVNYIEPVNIYTQSYRAIKYALLIVLLVLSALFLMETLAKLEIHPMQYLLLVLPLSVYYILLVALAEHTGFAVAYAIASGAVIVLLPVYFRGIGASLGQASGLSTLLGLIYGLILGMLASEDYALLIGAIFLFVALTSFMLLTRKLNWSKGIPMGEPSHG